jgi:uncharacterized oligopeptide transporter (OPT) family protein
LAIPTAPTPDGPSDSEPVDEATRSHFPRLSIAEWLTFAVLAALLAVTNIYTTLLTGWGDGGSIIAVLAAVAVLRLVTRQTPSIASLNLGQTMASAGGSVGFAVSFYAAVKMVQPDFQPDAVVFTLLFVGMGFVGALVGASVRRYLVHYYFPSGTACAVIQKTVTSSGTEAARPVRMLAIWSAISVLTVPTFAAILFAYVFRSPAIVPAGFRPGVILYSPPPARNVVYAIVGLFGVTLTAITANQVFGVSFHLTVLTVCVAWPLCIMNGRVTGDTDINPVRLVAVVLLTLFATLVTGGAVALLGIAIIGGTLAAMGVDMMQDYRTGYLINANPAHQTTVQIVGTIVGAVVAVPFILLIDARLGFGPGQPLPAPGAQIWAAMAEAFTGGAVLSPALINAIIVISLLGSVYAWLTLWPRTAPWMPSLFGIGIGLLLPFEMSAAIFLGGLLKLGTTSVYARGTAGEAREAAKLAAGNDTMLVGSAMFAASAIVSVFLVLLTSIMARLGIGWFYLAH